MAINSVAISHAATAQVDLTSSLGRLASGRRINSAADDPAGLGVVTNLDTNTASQRMAVRNTNDAMSLVQTAEGANSSVVANLQRMRELALGAASGTASPQARAAYEQEFLQLRDEIDRTAGSTQFNGQQLTDGSTGSVQVQAGTDSGTSSQIDVPLGDLTAAGLGIDTLTLGTAGSAQSALDAIDSALDTASSNRSDLGSVQSRLESAANLGESSAINSADAASRIGDLDFAMEVSEQAGASLRQQISVAALVQSNNIARAGVVGLL